MCFAVEWIALNAQVEFGKGKVATDMGTDTTGSMHESTHAGTGMYAAEDCETCDPAHACKWGWGPAAESRECMCLTF